mmetsp:Transcript_2093/g.6289  ORF Transcript_2093/g.6289 Transcript_2093/m.6289 type:complete len:201 (-) Transcript_2093:183-785(-)
MTLLQLVCAVPSTKMSQLGASVETASATLAAKTSMSVGWPVAHVAPKGSLKTSAPSTFFFAPKLRASFPQPWSAWATVWLESKKTGEALVPLVERQCRSSSTRMPRLANSSTMISSTCSDVFCIRGEGPPHDDAFSAAACSVSSSAAGPGAKARHALVSAARSSTSSGSGLMKPCFLSYRMRSRSTGMRTALNELSSRIL